jgi:hypothetical protein
MNAMSLPSLVEAPCGAQMPIRRILRSYVNEVRYETLRMFRSPGFSIPFLLLPVPVYLFFGVMLAAPAVAHNPGVANYLFSGFSVFAVMGPALFGVGCVIWSPAPFLSPRLGSSSVRTRPPTLPRRLPTSCSCRCCGCPGCSSRCRSSSNAGP